MKAACIDACNIYLRGSVYWIRYKHGGGLVRFSAKTRDRAEAQRLRDSLTRESLLGSSYVVADTSECLPYLIKSRERALRRDRKNSRESSFSMDELHALYARAGGRCEVTGIQFSLDKAPGTFRRPFAPSIDRVDSRIGYSFANCRLICLAINIGINEWGEDIFHRLAVGFLANRRAKTDIQRVTPEIESVENP